MFSLSCDTHLIDLDVAAIIFYLNSGHRFALFLLYFNRFDTFLQNINHIMETKLQDTQVNFLLIKFMNNTVGYNNTQRHLTEL